MTALTLVEAAKLAADSGETHKAGIISLYAEKSDILGAMKFEGISGSAVTFTQEGDLPTTAFRAVNQAFTPNNGTFNQQKEALYLAGGDVDVDNFLIKTGGADTRAKHEALKVKSLAQNVTDVILNGNNATDSTTFDGFKTRITESSVLIDAGSTANGAALSLKKLDQLIDSVNSPTHLIMSRAMRRKFMAAFRSSTFPNGLFSMAGGSDGGQASMTMSYNGLPILVGYDINKNTKILPFTEAAASGTATATSIYAVNFGEDGVMGISSGGIDVRDLGEINTAPVWRTRVEWYLGMAFYSPYAAARLRYIGDLDIVA
jgi:hypothetical protein